MCVFVYYYSPIIPSIFLKLKSSEIDRCMLKNFTVSKQHVSPVSPCDCCSLRTKIQ